MMRLQTVFAVIFLSALLVDTALGDANTAQVADVVVTATRMPQPSFDLPVSIDALSSTDLTQARQLVNLSEALPLVPGVLAQNRQNYAQDLQVSVRGFGARSTFGVRGVRLYTDGIPATLPDGQGQLSHFDLGSAGRIEVLRGPFSALYGNSSGGVISLFTEDAPPGFTATASASAASFDAHRYALKLADGQGPLNAVIDASRFETDGYRDHSSAQRDVLNAKARWSFSDTTHLTVVGNVLSLDANDPLGLTAQQVAADPEQAGVNAVLYNTRKSVDQWQLGTNFETRITEADVVSAIAYVGHRDTTQFQAIPRTVQAPITHPGGIIDLNRGYWGADAHWAHAFEGLGLTLTAGAAYDRLDERRKGYENFSGAQLGVRGNLRRDESNLAFNVDEYAQLQWEPSPSWLVIAGARHSVVKIDSDDHFIVPNTANGDDSGSVRYSATTPVAGATYHVSERLHTYASFGRGFETPTLNELAYKSFTASGLNLGLNPARSRHYEAGIKWRDQYLNINVDAFHVTTWDEIAVLASSGGRTLYYNAGKTHRDGAEAEADAELPFGLHAAAAYTLLRAVYDEPSNRIPAIPEHSAYAELSWTHRPSGLGLGVEGRWVSDLYADDQNAARVAGYVLANVRATLEQTFDRWRLQEYFRVDNIADRSYIGSVIANESNQRYFEPAPGRTWLIGFNAAVRM